MLRQPIIAAVLLAAQSARLGRRTALLAPAGRMAATNYIAQSVVLMVVYTGYGLALADDIAPLGVIAIALDCKAMWKDNEVTLVAAHERGDDQ